MLRCRQTNLQSRKESLAVLTWCSLPDELNLNILRVVVWIEIQSNNQQGLVRVVPLYSWWILITQVSFTPTKSKRDTSCRSVIDSFNMPCSCALLACQSNVYGNDYKSRLCLHSLEILWMSKSVFLLHIFSHTKYFACRNVSWEGTSQVGKGSTATQQPLQ